MQVKDDILSFIDIYDTIFIDVYGVLYDGIDLFENTLSTMRTIKDLGKKVIILSNTTQVAHVAKAEYAKRGMHEGKHYDKFVTSGEFLRHTVIEKRREFEQMIGLNVRSVKHLFTENGDVFEGSHIASAKSLENADFVYVGVPKTSYGNVRIDNLLDKNNNTVNIEDVISSNWNDLHDASGRRGPSEFAIVLEECLKENKTLVVANPDAFAHNTVDGDTKKVPIFTQGSIGKYYEKLGGKVVYFGKPYNRIFEFAKQYANKNDKIAMIGDTPWADILGANVSGIDSIMTMTGVSGEFFARMDPSMPLDEKFDILFSEISRKMTDIDNSVRPTYIIKQFACK